MSYRLPVPELPPFHQSVREQTQRKAPLPSSERNDSELGGDLKQTLLVPVSGILEGMMRSITESLDMVPSSASKARPNSTSSTSSSGSSGSNKRKSFEGDEGQENNSPNVPKKMQHTAEKKSAPTPVEPPSATKKFKDALMNGQSVLQTGANLFMAVAQKGIDDANTAMQLRSRQPAASALPRFNASASVRKLSIAAAPAIKDQQDKKIALTEQNTAERPSATPLKSNRSAKTPSKREVPATEEKPLQLIGPSSSCNAVIKRLKKAMTNTPTPEIIRNQFDTGFSIHEDRVATILSHLKVKSKWDFKEKAKKQEAVIKELRDCLSITFGEIKAVREQCLMHESHIINLIRDSYEEFVEVSHNLNLLQSTANSSQTELIKAREELRNASSTVMKFKTDQSPLRNRNKEYETLIQELQTALLLEQTQGDQSRNELCKVQTELSELKAKSESAIAQLKEEYEQRIEQSVQGYREEVATLRHDLHRRQSDVDRFSGERADLDRKKNELDAEILRANSRLREVESASARYEKEIDRYNAELDRLREQLTLKDTDLRNTINSLQEIQKSGNEEKNGMRTELSTAQVRVQLLEEERLKITSELASKKEEFLSCSRENAQLRESVANLEANLMVKEGEARAVKDIVLSLEVEKELRTRCELREEGERRERIAAVAQLLATQSECNNRIREMEDKNQHAMTELTANVAMLTKERDAAVEESRREAGRAAGLEKEVQQLHVELKNSSVSPETAEHISRVTGELEVMRRRLGELMASQENQSLSEAKKIAEYEDKLRAGEVQRRKLHNLVQELRGNVRVFARVRPFLPNDGLDMTKLPDPTITARGDMNSLRIYKAPTTSEERVEDHSFSFDKVFGPSCSQEALFEEVSEFVQSALDGYNVCLFSYGQTGSGKTHTMQGSGNGSMRGVIPRAMEQVGIYKKQLEAKGWDYQMEVSFVEIYNENIRDLLRTNAGDDVKHEIKHGVNGTTITDVTMIHVDPNDVEQIEKVLEQAARHRSVGKTEMNERSSRSHSVFCLHLKATNAAQGICLKGTLSLVDLAGSERLDRSGATGDQLKETVAINKSLSALADVFVAIGNKQSHIPFRNSKLTYLLQSALSGDGKTLMMVNLSPTLESFQESLCSLRLAKQINQCELGKPKKQVKEVTNVKESTSSKMQVCPDTPSGSAVPSTPSRGASAKQLSASLTTVNELASSSKSAATPQMMTASLGGRRPAPGTGTSTTGPPSASATAAKRLKK